MSFAPISLLAVTYEDYPGYWLKFYEQGTTTPLAMATDSAGGTLLAKAEISSGGTVPIGFIKTAGDAIFIPFVNGDYDSWLFPTAAEADANDTTNALQFADDLNANPLDAFGGVETLAALIEVDPPTSSGNIFLQGRLSAGDGGEGWFVWLSDPQTANVTADPQKGIWVAPSSDATGTSGAWKRPRPASGHYPISYWGAIAGSDNVTAIQAAENSGVTGIDLEDFESLFSTRIVVSSNVSFIGNGAILKRADSSTITSIFYVTAESIKMKGVAFDGNRANTTTGAHDVILENTCLNSDIQECEFYGAKSVSGGWGTGLFITGEDSSAVSNHDILNNEFHHNDHAGLTTFSMDRGRISGNKAYFNGSDPGIGIEVNNFDVTLTQKFDQVEVSGNIVWNNDGTGITIGNFIEDNNITTPLYGPADAEVTRMPVYGNSSTNNGSYGMAISGTLVNCYGNVCAVNGGTSVFWGGMLFNASFSLCTGNNINGNYFYGIDAGGSRSSKIEGNSIQNNGVVPNGVGLNLGTCILVDVTDNKIAGNGTAAAGRQITVGASDGDGAGGIFPFVTTNILIADNKIELTDSRRGIVVVDNPLRISVLDNYFTPAGSATADLDQCILFIAGQGEIKGNTIRDVDPLLAIDGAGLLQIPDVLEYAYTNSTTTIDSMRTFSQETVGDGIPYLTITAGGSGYTSDPTVVFTGGAGTGAAATAHISGGVLLGLRMTNYGINYTSAPTISFTGGGGSGATATAQYRLPNLSGREFSFHNLLAQTLTRLGDPSVVSPSGADISLPATGYSSYRSLFDTWILKSKNF